MKRLARSLGLSLCVALACCGSAGAAINVERHSHENPMVEVFRSTAYGAMAGAVVGGAIALATDDTSHDYEAVRWGIVGGTFLGLATGIYFAASRPQPVALLDLRDGEVRLHPLPTIEGSAGGGVRVHLVGMGF